MLTVNLEPSDRGEVAQPYLKIISAYVIHRLLDDIRALSSPDSRVPYKYVV
jgi:hypothetical protein